MAVDFIVQTKDNCIPEGQQCQVFDGIVTMPEKHIALLGDNTKMNTSCVAPALFYVFGSRGERFICDFHFALEHRNTRVEDRDHVFQYVFSNLESVREGFGEYPTRPGDPVYRADLVCFCDAPSVIQVVQKDGQGNNFCNFHFRKAYYRYLSNGIDMTKDFYVFDWRTRHCPDLHQELLNVPTI